VYDDGRGFELSDTSAFEHFGIAGMRERAKLANATLDLRSAVGAGTRVMLRVPMADPSQPLACGTSAEEETT
jgi:two-component system sensor histidine kinase UhpB